MSGQETLASYSPCAERCSRFSGGVLGPHANPSKRAEKMSESRFNGWNALATLGWAVAVVVIAWMGLATMETVATQDCPEVEASPVVEPLEGSGDE